MSKKLQRISEGNKTGIMPDLVHAGCVIHSNTYDWRYVERLYNMVKRHMPRPVQFHVWTEYDRSVPPHMTKHVLEEWSGISGAKRSWWYKMQMFNSNHYAGELLYFDLDVVILNDISWAVSQTKGKFWTLRDFRYLQRNTHFGINSSMMWWDTRAFHWVWEDFNKHPVRDIVGRYPGDQDYLYATIRPPELRTYAPEHVVSWRWQCQDGGWDFKARRAYAPGSGASVDPRASVIIFHGRPKPHELSNNKVVIDHWH